MWPSNAFAIQMIQLLLLLNVQEEIVCFSGREERVKLTSANSLCPQHLYYDFLLKHYLSYNEFRLLQQETLLGTK